MTAPSGIPQTRFERLADLEAERLAALREFSARALLARAINRAVRIVRAAISTKGF